MLSLLAIYNTGECPTYIRAFQYVGLQSSAFVSEGLFGPVLDLLELMLIEELWETLHAQESIKRIETGKGIRESVITPRSLDLAEHLLHPAFLRGVI